MTNRDIIGMKIFYYIDQFCHQNLAQALWQTACIFLISMLKLIKFDIIFKSVSLYIIHNEIQSFSLLIIVSFSHFDDIRMIQCLQQMEFFHCNLLIFLISISDNLNSEFTILLVLFQFFNVFFIILFSLLFSDITSTFKSGRKRRFFKMKWRNIQSYLNWGEIFIIIFIIAREFIFFLQLNIRKVFTQQSFSILGSY